MKKILFALVAVVAVCSLTSCSKTCRCTAKVNDEVVYDQSYELQEGEKCSDHSGKISVLGQILEAKCSTELF